MSFNTIPPRRKSFSVMKNVMKNYQQITPQIKEPYSLLRSYTILKKTNKTYPDYLNYCQYLPHINFHSQIPPQHFHTMLNSIQELWIMTFYPLLYSILEDKTIIHRSFSVFSVYTAHDFGASFSEIQTKRQHFCIQLITFPSNP